MEVLAYFQAKASRYDEVDTQSYWVFSDKLLWHLLTSHALPRTTQKPLILLDAGCGTARWSHKVLEHFPHAFAHLVDISPAMLEVARAKVDASRVAIYTSDVQSMPEIAHESIDTILCLHNVIGFVQQPEVVLKRFHQLLKPGGIAAVMFPSFYHALYFANAQGRVKELDRIARKQVCYNDQMPPLTIFELEEIERLANNVGFKTASHYGFPITLYPGMEETFISGSSTKITRLFENPHAIQTLYELEKELVSNPRLAARGNNILTVFKKN